MNKPILTIYGATGVQGRSVLSAFTDIEEPPYQIRALTHDCSSTLAKDLAANPYVTVIEINKNSVDSLLQAFKDTSVIFANTAFPPETFVRDGASAAQSLEERHGLNVALAASKVPSLQHLIWSTLPDAFSITDQKIHVPHFQSKQAAESYIKATGSNLFDKTTFLRVGLYGSNLAMNPYRPFYSEATKKYVIRLPCSADVRFPFAGDENVNVGLVVKAIIANPKFTLRRYVLGGSETMTCEDWAAALTRALRRQGKFVGAVYAQCTLAEYEQVWGQIGTEVGLMFAYFDHLGPRSFEMETGSEPLLYPKDLGIEEELKSTEDRLATINWEEY
ncbi:hypothetical protein FSARC_20 [Fusarium sarcochroum]|uniref:NmrA-like domain-containing protein n=1 Tax=Fusarium sarcochroum TaxID=1208366 RepID=A0A8H4UCW6_9HYPO|nr:hypothetical protein FSARC_20 [Fusarium sarcochroum]